MNFLKRLPIAPIIFMMATLIFCGIIAQNIGYWGQKDWDQFTFWYAVPQKTILRYHQFPLWNPYANGGNVLLAHPHSGFLNPFFVFILLFGPVVGLKLLIFIHVFLGLAGMFYFARLLGLRRLFAYPVSFIYMFSSIFPLHLTEGHFDFISMAYIPWILFFALGAVNRLSRVIFAALLLALMIFSGAVYPLVVLIFFMTVFFVLSAVKSRNYAHIKVILFTMLGALLLSGIKIVPMLEFIKENPRVVTQRDGMTLPLLFTSLSDSRQELYDREDWEPTNINEWHEYGAYVGSLPMILALFAALFYFKELWPLITTVLLSLIIVMGNKFIIDTWHFLHYLPIFSNFSSNSRFILGFMIGFAVLAGFGLDRFYKITGSLFKNKIVPVLACVFLILFICVDLIAVNARIFKNAFTLEPMNIKPLKEFCQVEGEILDSRARSSMYPAFLRNCGVVDGYEVMHIPKGDIHRFPGNLKDILEDKEEDKLLKHCKVAYLAGKHGETRVQKFSPNAIKIWVKSDRQDTLVLNQNFHKGWRIREPGFRVISFKGLIATNIAQGSQAITFYYLPNTFLLGAFISIFGLLFLAYMYMKFRKRESFH